MPNYCQTIYLASGEYGNELMEHLAREQFNANPDLRCVDVYEHAGWFLAWGRMPDGSIGIVATANDTASVTEFRREFWKTYRYGQVYSRDSSDTRIPLDSLGSIWRDKSPKPEEPFNVD